ncbi:MAG: OmpA family protein [Pseudomonadota bacterium]
MSTSLARPVLLAIAIAVMSACSSMPEQTSLLDQDHADFMRAQNDQNVARYAQLELKNAADALAAADAAAAKHAGQERIDQLAYVAKQQIALSVEVGKEKAASAEQDVAAAQREQIRLAQRTQEAENAKRGAELARMQAEQARAQALLAQNDAAASQRAAADALRATSEAQARSAQLEAQLADLAAKQTERGLVITLGDVLFGTDMDSLTLAGLNTAQKLADVLKQHPERSVLVEGFTDSTGSAQHNQDLSERRAQSVRSALQGMGIGASRVAIHGYGEAYPVASNASVAERQRNRRVEIVLSDENGKTVQR